MQVNGLVNPGTRDQDRTPVPVIIIRAGTPCLRKGLHKGLRKDLRKDLRKGHLLAAENHKDVVK